MTDSQLHWRGAFENAEVEALHAEAFQHSVSDHDWQAQLERHSLGWVCVRVDGRLVGFVNVAWDGAAHAFLLDTMVLREYRHRGIGAALVVAATEGARTAGCEWLHVDYTDDLTTFYQACGFRPTPAGLIRLSPSI